ncbi:protein LBH-like isoform X1 [Scleropages formosus]|uniref:protein LBH-like isoform X1 n=1 Tax=Scleropages formosus TaxID=113540 RepID=UPI0008781634|nr:protein LBH-like isoform X1 [Scleropages formosus]
MMCTGEGTQEMNEVVTSSPMEDMCLSTSQDQHSYQIFPDPTDFECYCKLKDHLPCIVVEPTEDEVESGELRWPPEELLVSDDKEEKTENKTVQPVPTSQP